MPSDLKNIVVFCASSSGSDAAFVDAARDLGSAIAARGSTLIYGGGNVGLMGTVADATLAGGGRVVGIIPHGLEKREVAHRGVTELVVVNSMHERKKQMAERADAFVALPGGYGTMEEIMEVITWAQLGIHRCPCAFLNVAGYYDAFFTFLDHACASGLLKPQYREMILVENEIEKLFDSMAAYESPVQDQWIELPES